MSNFWIIYYGIICIVGLIVAFKQLKGSQDDQSVTICNHLSSPKTSDN